MKALFRREESLAKRSLKPHPAKSSNGNRPAKERPQPTEKGIPSSRQVTAVYCTYDASRPTPSTSPSQCPNPQWQSSGWAPTPASPWRKSAPYPACPCPKTAASSHPTPRLRHGNQGRVGSAVGPHRGDEGVGVRWSDTPLVPGNYDNSRLSLAAVDCLFLLVYCL